MTASPDLSSLRHDVVQTPIGEITMVRTDRGVCGLYMELTKSPLTDERIGVLDPGGLDDVAEQLTAYFDGSLTMFDVPLDLHGTDFQRQVWEALLEIPYGETRSYLQQAERIGDVRAIRAVGTANGRNPVSIIVPCHRVIGSDGSLTGYAGGLERKRYLLDLEARVSGETLF